MDRPLEDKGLFFCLPKFVLAAAGIVKFFFTKGLNFHELPLK
ncbi:hypothetical protein PAECIP111890_03698 [Paenibacillus sp. JJ-223]|nr:hypothetical protein PAECIP111890_03698 [Paenibacillus sp. JJ-223]